MPVLSESQTSTLPNLGLPFSSTLTIPLLGVLFLAIYLIRRRSNALPKPPPSAPTTREISEKLSHPTSRVPNAFFAEKPQPRPLPPPSFTPPALITSSSFNPGSNQGYYASSLTNSPMQEELPNNEYYNSLTSSPMQEELPNNEYYHPSSPSERSPASPSGSLSPVFSQTTTFDSFSSPSEDLPRRRSYTKTLTMSSTGSSSAPGSFSSAGMIMAGQTSRTNSIEVSGEILTTDTWRRHTRVFGGGVCKACEESQRRMGMSVGVVA